MSTFTPEILITSALDVIQMDALESLLFFNANQSNYRAVIIRSIERFGEPRVRVEGHRLRVHTRTLGEVQALFAVERPSGVPVAAAVYARTSETMVTVLHMAVDPDYSGHGSSAGAMVGLRLIRAVVSAMARVKGVETVELLYRPGGVSGTTISVR